MIFTQHVLNGSILKINQISVKNYQNSRFWNIHFPTSYHFSLTSYYFLELLSVYPDLFSSFYITHFNLNIIKWNHITQFVWENKGKMERKHVKRNVNKNMTIEQINKIYNCRKKTKSDNNHQTRKCLIQTKSKRCCSSW